eukprot:4178273-Amphidinium_carterae.2
MLAVYVTFKQRDLVLMDSGCPDVHVRVKVHPLACSWCEAAWLSSLRCPRQKSPGMAEDTSGG